MSTINDRNPRMLPRIDSAELFDERRVGLGSLSPFSSCGRRQRVGHAGEILHRAVVKIAGDLTSLDVARLERAVEEELSLPEAQAQAARE